MKPEITFTDWMKLDVRLGTIVEAFNPEWSNKLIELHVEFGAELGQRTIFTAMRDTKSPEDFTGKQALFLVNLPPKKMGEAQSEGMILAIDRDGDSNSEPVLVLFDNIAPNGSPLA